MKKTIIVILTLLALVAVLDFIFIIKPCIDNSKNYKQSFDIVFNMGASEKDLVDFANAFKGMYQNVSIEEITTEEEFINKTITDSSLSSSTFDSYKKELTDKKLVKSMISVSASTKDLGDLIDFEDFMAREINKYSSLKFKQYNGASPEIFLKDSKTSSYCKSPKLAFDLLYHLFKARQ